MSYHRPVIVLLDLGPSSATVLKVAHNWATRLGSPLMIIHQVQVVLPVMADARIRQDMLGTAITSARQELLRICKTASVTKDQLEQIIVEDRPLLPLVLSIVNEHKAMMVVAGMKRKGLIDRLLLGNKVLELVDELSVPLLTVPCEDVEGDHEPVLFMAVGPTVDPNTALLTELLDRLHGDRPQLRFFTLLEGKADRGKAMERLRDVAARMPVANDARVDVLEHTDGREDLGTWLKGRPGAMVVLQRGPRGITDLLFRRSFVNDLVQCGSVPLLVLP